VNRPSGSIEANGVDATKLDAAAACGYLWSHIVNNFEGNVDRERGSA